MEVTTSCAGPFTSSGQPAMSAAALHASECLLHGQTLLFEENRKGGSVVLARMPFICLLTALCVCEGGVPLQGGDARRGLPRPARSGPVPDKFPARSGDRPGDGRGAAAGGRHHQAAPVRSRARAAGGRPGQVPAGIEEPLPGRTGLPQALIPHGRRRLRAPDVLPWHAPGRSAKERARPALFQHTQRTVRRRLSVMRHQTQKSTITHHVAITAQPCLNPAAVNLCRGFGTVFLTICEKCCKGNNSIC